MKPRRLRQSLARLLSEGRTILIFAARNLRKRMGFRPTVLTASPVTALLDFRTCT